MINQRIFSANVGDISTGQAGPDAIEQDIDNLLANDQELLGITGDKTTLTTDTKVSLVAAINEHETQINTLDANKADEEHEHTKSDITDFPSSLPANGGNSDTVDTMHIWVGAEGSKGTNANTIYFCY